MECIDKSDNLLLRPQTSGRVCDLDAEHLRTFEDSSAVSAAHAVSDFSSKSFVVHK